MGNVRKEITLVIDGLTADEQRGSIPLLVTNIK